MADIRFVVGTPKMFAAGRMRTSREMGCTYVCGPYVAAYGGPQIAAHVARMRREVGLLTGFTVTS